MHSGRWGVEEEDAWEPPRSAPNRQNGRYVPDVDELDYTSAPRYHEHDDRDVIQAGARRRGHQGIRPRLAARLGSAGDPPPPGRAMEAEPLPAPRRPVRSEVRLPDGQVRRAGGGGGGAGNSRLPDALEPQARSERLDEPYVAGGGLRGGANGYGQERTLGRGRMRSDDPLFGKGMGKWGHDGFEALSKEPDPVPMLW
ncbi:hypothetical protein WJX81_006854 [Elliptochloris bilobata]|uniref:Uncharacterized protein n=1 Tax=Elliptochloris bilobata TaxID=381761 RepID=A0AAW1RY68_9CHLO